MYSTLTKNVLEQFINVDNLSYELIGRQYGCSCTYIKKLAKKFGIYLPQRRKINENETFNKGIKKVKTNFCKYCGKEIKPKNTFCNNKCLSDYEYKQWLLLWKNNEVTGITGKYLISNYLRRYIFEKYNCKCARCGWSEINPYTNKLPLEIEHIDGNFMNNNEDNLTLLCPNCHSLTSTYKGANKGHGRYNRKTYI